MRKDKDTRLLPEDVASFLKEDDLRNSEKSEVIHDLYQNYRSMIAEPFRDDMESFRKQVDHLLILWRLPPDEAAEAGRILSEMRNTVVSSGKDAGENASAKTGKPIPGFGRQEISFGKDTVKIADDGQKLRWLREHYPRSGKRKILFCNIAYMNRYEGSADDIPVGAGKWVAEHRDGHEKWNFLNYDGLCYGFVQNKGRFRLERFDGVPSSARQTDGVTVVWCAPKEKDKTVIVGWYENAVVYRDYESCVFTAATGIDRWYFCHADADDCYLLPEEERTFEIPRASIAGTGKGFGQQNYWYAESEYARKELIPRAIQFMDSHKRSRINRTNGFFGQMQGLSGGLSEAERRELSDALEKQDFEKILPLAYRSYGQTQSADDAYHIAVCYQELFQFREAVKWLEIAERIEGPRWDTAIMFPYWYQQIQEYQKSLEYTGKILHFPEGKNRDAMDEAYCLMADNHYCLGNLDEAVKYLDLVIQGSGNPELVSHVQNVKSQWMEYPEGGFCG